MSTTTEAPTGNIVIDSIILNGNISQHNENLVVEYVNTPEVLNAYFAEKTVKEETIADGTYEYTFERDTDTSSKTKRSNVVKEIHTAINAILSPQNKEVKQIDIQAVIDIKATDSKWPIQSHKKDATLTFDQYKTETKTYYKKITSAPIGYQVYLVAETKNLKDQKVKLKIHEKEDSLKLLKTKDDVLPVLAFAKEDDTTTDTEVSDWIEIDVKEKSGKKENGDLFLYKEEQENKVEVGIKKIQLRPKEDKIKTEGEDTSISFEGWQEALYIRENETEEGKKAIEDEKKAKTARDAETTDDVILKFDDEAEKKTYPAGKIDAPKTAIVGKLVEYTLDIDIDDTSYKYKAKATEEDKKNIRWSFYVQGESKTDKASTYITAKSKSGLYTYAKTEVIGEKIKLTIIFDEALVGKKVQIEPFRGSPDLSTKPDFVRTTTVQKDNIGPLIKKLDFTNIWLLTKCDGLNKEGGENIKKFLENSYFKLEAKPLWTNPIENSEITLYNFSAVYKPKGSTFGEVRLKKHKVTKKLVPKAHTGLDVFAEKGTGLKACLDGTVERIYGKSSDTEGYGVVIVIEVDSVEYLTMSKNKYAIKYAGEIEEGPDFNLNNKIYLRYAHVQKSLVKVGDRVKSGDKIALSGVSGNATGTRAPHLHFEIANKPRPARGLVNRCNPSFYVNLIDELKADKEHQKKISEKAHKI